MDYLITRTEQFNIRSYVFVKDLVEPTANISNSN